MKRALLLACMIACSPDRGPKWKPAGNASPREGGTLHIATKDQIDTLDPSIQYGEVGAPIIHSMFDTLVDYEHDGLRLIPRLAEKWELSPDGLVYRFTLRAGIQYSDGVAATSADIKYSLERALSMADSPFGPFLADVAPGGITTPSDRELVIRLTAPNVAFIYVMTMGFTTPQRRDHVEKVGDQVRRMPLGTGPFMLAEWSEGERLVMRRNPHYWDAARAHLDAIEMRENVPRDVQFLMFERGELDSVDKLPAPELLWVTEQPEWAPYIQRRAGMNAYGSRFNVRRKPFDDRRVRQALNYAHNKQYTVKLLNGAAVPAHGLLPPGTFGRDDALAPYPHDPAKARALLAEAGYPDGFETDYYVVNDEEAEKLAASRQGDLAAVGVRMNIKVVTFSTLGAMLTDPKGPPFMLDGWFGDYPDPTNFLEPRFHSKNIREEASQNTSFYANPELDQILDRARGELDVSARAALYHRAERILYDDAPWIWEYHQQLTEVTQPYVKDYVLHPLLLRDYTPVWLDLGAGGERVSR